MPLYFFDSRDNDFFVDDDTGSELPDLELGEKRMSILTYDLT
jgi:hypothetical protein